ncbi:alpha/beta hydrolase family protein [Streptomyces boninensis]|uniref:alpha/beta hydrolase family protein n=1 Tax=Streptomyces boninensis TaxID=2039455 RepID=UPI003B2125C4
MNPLTSREPFNRRRLLATALAAGATVPLGLAGPVSSAASASPPPRLTLPAPTGPYPVGMVALHLLGPAARGRRRELMASVWYPARETWDAREARNAPAAERHPRVPWMSDALLRELLASAGFPPGAVRAPLTAGRRGAPARRLSGGRGLPVVVYSHGAHSHRADHTVIVQELASHGYAVVTLDHTDDAFTEFPDGRTLVPSEDPQDSMGPADFAADIRCVLDRLADLAAGRNPDLEGQPLPAHLAEALDLRRIGMLGWSKGGTATAHVMAADPRVWAGLGLDGPMIPAISAGLNRPFMMMTAEFTRADEPAVADFWQRLRGWRLNIQAEGAVHSSYGDNQVLIPQLAEAVGMSDAELRGYIGTLAPHRAVRIQQAYPRAFFDLHLRHRGGQLLDGPSRKFPEVTYLP